MVLVIGAGLAGCLAALALRERGLPVTLLSQAPALATASQFSYGGVPWWGAPALARAAELWQALERRHGPLGWQSCTLTLHGGCANPPDDPQALAAAGAGLEARLVAAGESALVLLGDQGQLLGLELPYGRVDGVVLAAALPAALERAGVRRHTGSVLALECPGASPWRVRLAGGDTLEAETVLLAAGAASTQLWPPLKPELATSWAGVLALSADDLAACDLPSGARTGIVMPLLGQRQALEQQTPSLGEARAVVDAGLAPWGTAWLLGQISLVNPLGQFDPEPDPAWMEARLRSGLARVWPQLARLPARYHQLPVSFTATGVPLVGPVAQAPGLWVCAGVGSPFAALPPLLETLADQLAAGSRS
jgi:glycine/D-amino acid oxidase-like deaminating enzyme